MASDNVVNVTQESFESTVLKADKPVLVDFWAEWCGPCKMVAPVLDELAEEIGDQVQIAKVNVDDNNELAFQYQVSSIPTMILFKDGEVADRVIGAMPKASIQQFLDSHV